MIAPRFGLIQSGRFWIVRDLKRHCEFGRHYTSAFARLRLRYLNGAAA